MLSLATLHQAPRLHPQSSFKNIPNDVLPLILAGLDPAETWNFGCTSRSALLTLPKDKRQAFRKHLTCQLQKTREAFLQAIDFERRFSSTWRTLLTIYYTIACSVYLGENYRFHLDPGEDSPWTRAGVPIASALAMGICCLLVRCYHTSFSQQEYIDFMNRNTEVDTRMHEPESACSFIGRLRRSAHGRKYFILCYEVIACSALINVVTNLTLYIHTQTDLALSELIVLGLPLLYMATWGMISFLTPSKDVLKFNRRVNEARQALDTHLGLSNASETKPPELPLQAANERSGLTEPLLVIVRP
jgi:hypothetical protein